MEDALRIIRTAASYYRDKEQLFLDRLSKIEEGPRQLPLDRSTDN